MDGRGSLRLVVCDDAEDTRELFGDILRRAGHDVTLAHDGQSALAAIARTAPHAALIDISLPDMSGYDIVRIVRHAAAPPYPRFVAVTGYGTAADRAASFAAGFDAHLTKPANIQELLAALYGAPPSAG